MGSQRALLFDYLLVAGLVVLVFAGVVALLRLRSSSKHRWTVVSAGVGLLVIGILFGPELLDAVTGANSSVYPDQPDVVILVGFVITAVLAVSVFDSVSVRAQQLSTRVTDTAWVRTATVPLLIATGVVGIAAGLTKLDPPRPTQTSTPTEASIPDSTTNADAPPQRPAQITMSAFAADGSDTIPDAPDLVLSAITQPGDLQLPTFLASPPQDDRLFVLERSGRVRVIDNDGLRTEPLIDITHKVQSGTDGGLIGLAFHPEYDTNGRVFIHYTDLDNGNRIVEYQLDPATATLISDTPTQILHLEQPTGFHAGGMLQFGPDQLLYIAIGEGSDYGINERLWERDPLRVAQDPDILLGTILRLDVDGGAPYVVPLGNAFDGRQPNETFAYGLRNPWRFWIDPPTNQMFIGDVGQVTWEEINVLDLDTAGINFGWDTTEGTGCYLLRSEFIADCDRTGLTAPILEYRNFRANPPGVTGGPCAVILGGVYRGAAMPDLEGTILYADYCSPWIAGFRYDNGQVVDNIRWVPSDDQALGTPTSFGHDNKGEYYLLTSAGGMIYKIGPG